MRILVESLKRLYINNKITEDKILEIYFNDKITHEEKEYILNK